MRLLRRVYADKRAFIAPFGIALVANALLYAVAVYPLGRKADTAAQRNQRASQAVRAAESNYARAQSTAAGKSQANTELRSFYEDVLPVGLSGARRITYVRLAQLASDSGLQFARRTLRTEQDSVDSALTKLQMTMVLGGQYRDVRRFIHDLETAEDFIVIEDVALSQADEVMESLVLTLGVATYYRTGDDGS